jgi:hypothetical protein
MSNYSIIHKAIENKQQIFAIHNGYKRSLCPHVLGSIKGVSFVLFYQFAGESDSGLSKETDKNWRLFPVEDLREVQYIEGPFFPAGKSKADKTLFEKIDFKVA